MTIGQALEEISIHVPREGDDCLLLPIGIMTSHFNPRPP